MAEISGRALTHRRVLNIAFPVVISNATVPILGAVDTGVVGQLGEAVPIGAVGIGAIILAAVYWIFGFLRMGTAGLTAQSIGAEDRAETCALLMRALMIGLAGGLALILLQLPLFWAAFRLAPASPEVEVLASDYMRIRIFSAPAAIAIYGITGWLVAHERTGSVLVLQLWMNGLNVLLDIGFVLKLGWGVEGVAAATVIAEWSALGLGLWLTRDAFAQGHWRNRASVFDRVRLRNMTVVNSDIMIRSVLLQIAFVSFLFLGSSFDDVTLAANQVLLQFLYITAYALDGFAFAAEALVGRSLGAKNRAALRRSVVLTSQWGAGVTVLVTLGFAIGGTTLIRIMTTAVDVQQAAFLYLPWMVLAPLLGGASWMLDGIFIGATQSRDMRNMMAVSICFYGLFLVLLMPAFGNHGLWASLILFFVVRGVTLGLRYPALERAADEVS
ncbi:MAG: MATE family efflux transporter [Rhodobacteraceae bacterium]|nr:MATE family efflux transporter [Paracoccaceae bacterium]